MLISLGKVIELPTFLQKKRLDAGLTLKQMARIIGVKPGTYTSWEYGNTIPIGVNRDRVQKEFPIDIDILLSPVTVVMREDGLEILP